MSKYLSMSSFDLWFAEIHVTWLCRTNDSIILLNVDIITVFRWIHSSNFSLRAVASVAKDKPSIFVSSASDEGAKDISCRLLFSHLKWKTCSLWLAMASLKAAKALEASFEGRVGSNNNKRKQQMSSQCHRESFLLYEQFLKFNCCTLWTSIPTNQSGPKVTIHNELREGVFWIFGARPPNCVFAI
jgi:hypothetical protein